MLLVLASVAILTAPGPPPPSAAPQPWRAIPEYGSDTLTPEEARADLALFRRAIESIHPGLHRYSDESAMTRVLDALEEEFAAGGTARELYRAVSLAAAEIRCGHTRVEAPAAYDEYRERVPTHLPFHFRLLENRMIVERAASSAPRLTRGTEVTAINGVPVAELVEQIGATVPIDGMTDHIRPSRLDAAYEFADCGLDHYLPLFRGFRDDFRLACRTAEGESFTVVAPAVTSVEWRGLVPTGARSFAKSVTQEDLDERTTLLRVDSFINYRDTVDPVEVYAPIFRDLNERGVEHLVIDLRANGGGSSDAAWALASFLVDAPIRFKSPLVRNYRYDEELKTHLTTWVDGALDMPDGAFEKRDDGWFELLPWASGRASELAPHPDRYAGSVTVLAGPYNASGTTMLLATLQEAERVRVVGTPTGGSAEGPTAGVLLTLRLPHSGISVNIPALFERSPVLSFESGLGVTPDLHVAETVADFRAGVDRVLEAALDSPAAGPGR